MIAFLDALHRFDTQAGSRTELEAALGETLRRLWHSVTEPILDALGHRNTPASGTWPRVWWCPTGPLALLPLHAAGDHHGNATGYDRVISSYTPTVAALHRARTRPRSRAADRMLVVALPETPGQKPLRGTARELAVLNGLVDRRTVLLGSAATHDAVRTQLADHRFLHAACHGTQDLSDPASGGLFPYDWEAAGLLTVAQLAQAGWPGGDLAVLSACRTATAGAGAPDEAVSVAAALHHSGWRQVIATLWPVWDEPAAALAERVYGRLCRDGLVDPEDAAAALHDAVREMRSSERDRPSVWAPFIHIGA